MNEERDDICPAEQGTYSADAIRLTPEQWEGVAEFVGGVSDLLCELITPEANKEFGEELRRIMGYAAAAALYVGLHAADTCIFSVKDAREEKHGADN